MIGRVKDFLSLGIISICLSACGGNSDKSSFATEEEIHSLMLEELDPAADGIWDNAGYILTEAGEESLFPETEAEWSDVASSADAVAEIARRLADDHYAQGRQDWKEIAHGLEDAAETVRRATAEQDQEALFDAGGYVYRVCVACHERYMLNDETSAD